MRVSRNEHRRCRVAQICSIQRAINLHCRAKFRRAIGQIEALRHRPLLTHERFPNGRFQSPNQNCLGCSRRLANGVETKMVSINQVNVRNARRTPHRTISFGLTARGVAGGIVAQVGFSLDDGSATRSVRRVANEPMPQQQRRDHFGRRLVKFLRQRKKLH